MGICLPDSSLGAAHQLVANFATVLRPLELWVIRLNWLADMLRLPIELQEDIFERAATYSFSTQANRLDPSYALICRSTYDAVATVIYKRCEVRWAWRSFSETIRKRPNLATRVRSIGIMGHDDDLVEVLACCSELQHFCGWQMMRQPFLSLEASRTLSLRTMTVESLGWTAQLCQFIDNCPLLEDLDVSMVSDSGKSELPMLRSTSLRNLKRLHYGAGGDAYRVFENCSMANLDAVEVMPLSSYWRTIPSNIPDDCYDGLHPDILRRYAAQIVSLVLPCATCVPADFLNTCTSLRLLRLGGFTPDGGFGCPNRPGGHEHRHAVFASIPASLCSLHFESIPQLRWSDITNLQHWLASSPCQLAYLGFKLPYEDAYIAESIPEATSTMRDKVDSILQICKDRGIQISAEDSGDLKRLSARLTNGMEPL